MLYFPKYCSIFPHQNTIHGNICHTVEKISKCQVEDKHGCVPEIYTFKSIPFWTHVFWYHLISFLWETSVFSTCLHFCQNQAAYFSGDGFKWIYPRKERLKQLPWKTKWDFSKGSNLCPGYCQKGQKVPTCPQYPNLDIPMSISPPQYWKPSEVDQEILSLRAIFPNTLPRDNIALLTISCNINSVASENQEKHPCSAMNIKPVLSW